MRETAEAPGQRDNEDTKFAVQVQRMSGRASIAGKRAVSKACTGNAKILLRQSSPFMEQQAHGDTASAPRNRPGPARSTIIAWPDENEPHRQLKDSFERPLN